MSDEIVTTNTNKFLIFGLVFLVLLAAAPSLYFYNQYAKLKKTVQNPAGASQEEIKAITAKVSKLIDLPSDEIPALITVSDKEKLKDQPFFAKAKNGDLLLVFNNAKKAILYDPIANRVLEVGPILEPSLSVNPANPSISPLLSQPVMATIKAEKTKIVLYNGTATTGLTSQAEKILKEKVAEVEVTDKSNAGKKDYEKTLVIDLTGNNKTLAEKIATVLNGDISTLPAGEIKPAESSTSGTVDILAIIGKNIIKSPSPTTASH